MSRRVNWLAGAVVALLVVCLGGQAQQSPYGVEEWNSFQDTRPDVTADPETRLELIDKFLQDYPESVLRPFVYLTQAQTAYSLNRYELAMQAVDNLLAMDRQQVESFLKQSQYNDLQVKNHYYTAYRIYAFSFLQVLNNDASPSRSLLEEGRQRAQQALRLHEELYSQVTPPSDPEARKQFEQQKQQTESAYRSMLNPHPLLANAAWKNKDYSTAAREYRQALEAKPREPLFNYRLGLAHLRKKPAEEKKAFWYLARAVAYNITNGGKVRDYLTKVMAAYQQVPPDCLGQQVQNLIDQAPNSTTPPAIWDLPDADAVQAVRQTMSVKRIFEELSKGGEDARLMYLASCGTEIGVGDNGQPELAVMVLGVNQQGTQVVLRAAAGQEAVDAKRPNLELVTDASGATNLKAEDVVRVSGKITGYTRDPQFLLKLSNGKVHPEDLPKSTARRGG